MNFKAAAAIAALGVAVSGCASIVEGTTQNLAVLSAPADGAKCTLTSSEGTYFVTTPGSTVVHKTKSDLTVLCKKDGYQDTTMVVPSHFNGATAGNIIAGGIIGIGIDAATGANYNYPNTITVQMTQVGVAAPPANAPAPATVTAPPKPTS